MFIPLEAQRGKGTSPRKHVDGGVGIDLFIVHLKYLILLVHVL